MAQRPEGDPKDNTAYCVASMSVSMGCSCFVLLLPVLLAAGMQPAPAAGVALVVGCACGGVLTVGMLNALLKSLMAQSDPKR